MTVSTGRDALVTEIHITAEPERIFQALTDPAQVPQWWGQKGFYLCETYEADLRVGGEWRSAGVGRDGAPFEVKGKFLEIDSPRRLSYTWVASWTGRVQTSVQRDLTATQDGTRVTITHSGLAKHPELTQSYRGWPRMLAWLQTYLEKGETAETRPAV
jgi:uncharacterized protein YndB with AHSA1/START domain